MYVTGTLLGPGKGAGLPTPRNEKNAPSSVERCPKWGSEKKFDTQKWGFFHVLLHFINKRKCPMVEKVSFFPKKALKMPGWQHWKGEGERAGGLPTQHHEINPARKKIKLSIFFLSIWTDFQVFPTLNFFTSITFVDFFLKKWWNFDFP